LNVAEPLVAGDYGKAAFDAVGPLLLIGWAEVGPGLLQAMVETCRSPSVRHPDGVGRLADVEEALDGMPACTAGETVEGQLKERSTSRRQDQDVDDDLLERARQEDARHWEECRRPISAETLRKRLGVGAARSRMLVSMVRSGQSGRTSLHAMQTG
jgi:hypothetical protein